MKLSLWARILMTLCVAWLVSAAPAEAYLDPGAGSLLFQFAVAAFFGALFFLRSLWRRLFDLFRSKARREEE